MKNTIRVIVAPIFISGIALTFAACGQAGGGATTIKVARPTAAGVKLNTCADAKLSGQAKTFKGTEGTVCRVVDGKLKDQKHEALFSAVKRHSRVGVFQRIVFNITKREADGTTLKLEGRERAMAENDVNIFMDTVCRPIAKKVFSRSEVEGAVVFRVKKATGDEWAKPTLQTSKATGNTRISDDPFESTRPVKAQQISTKDNKDEATKRSDSLLAQSSDYHAELELDLNGEGVARQIKIADEVEAVTTPIILLEKPSDEQIRFCSQLVLRAGENFGLTHGRDCASRQAAAIAPSTEPAVKQSAGPGLMKAGLDLKSVKVSESEVLEVIKPVCGSL